MNMRDKKDDNRIDWSLFEDAQESLWVPKGISERFFHDNGVGKKVIREIYKDYDLVLDRIMWFISSLVSDHRIAEYKPMSSEIMKDVMGENYKAIINLLRYKQPISNYTPKENEEEWLITCDDHYASPNRGNSYTKSKGCQHRKTISHFRRKKISHKMEMELTVLRLHKCIKFIEKRKATSV